MDCELFYCIYNKSCECTLAEIMIDAAGVCGSCEMVVVPGEILENYKDARLREIPEMRKQNNN